MPVKFTITLTERPGHSVGMDVELHEGMATEREIAFAQLVRDHFRKLHPPRFKPLAVIKDWQPKRKAEEN